MTVLDVAPTHFYPEAMHRLKELGGLELLIVYFWYLSNNLSNLLCKFQKKEYCETINEDVTKNFYKVSQEYNFYCYPVDIGVFHLQEH